MSSNNILGEKSISHLIMSEKGIVMMTYLLLFVDSFEGGRCSQLEV